MGFGLNLYELVRIPISRRCNGYYLRWYYNGWHYWLWHPGRIVFITEGEKYRTLGTQTLTIGSGQITEEQVRSIRTIKNTKEINIYTDSGWGVVRLIPGSVITYNNQIHGYEVEITIIIGSKQISRDGFSPAISIPVVDPSYEYCETMCIGDQIWMCKNYDSYYPGSRVYNNDEDNRAEYGGLYKHNQVMASGFVPAGWKVPTIAEWTTLITECGGVLVAGGELKEIGTTHWNAPNTGAVDTYNFSALGGGRYGFLLGVGTQYHYFKVYGFFWAQDGFIRMDYDSAEITVGTGIILPGEYYSVRLLRIEPCIITPIKNGLLYNWYMAKGLNDWFLPSRDELNAMYVNLHSVGFGGFSNGSYHSSSEYNDVYMHYQIFLNGNQSYSGKASVFHVRACRSFEGELGEYSLRDVGQTGGLIFYINGTTYYEAAPSDQHDSHVWSNIVNVLVGTNTAIGTGKANTTAIINQEGHIESAAKLCDDLSSDENNIAPAGWHVPTDVDWNELATFVGGSGIAGGILKEMGLTYWLTPNTGASNDYGFSARGAGERSGNTGVFQSILSMSRIWSIDEYSPTNGKFILMEYNTDNTTLTSTNKKAGQSIRLIKDDSNDPGTMTGNDGKIYATIKIGNQVWLSRNLAETKDRNGNTIPEVTDNVAWLALETGALCAYDNDWDNV